MICFLIRFCEWSSSVIPLIKLFDALALQKPNPASQHFLIRNLDLIPIQILPFFILTDGNQDSGVTLPCSHFVFLSKLGNIYLCGEHINLIPLQEREILWRLLLLFDFLHLLLKSPFSQYWSVCSWPRRIELRWVFGWFSTFYLFAARRFSGDFDYWCALKFLWALC